MSQEEDHAVLVGITEKLLEASEGLGGPEANVHESLESIGSVFGSINNTARDEMTAMAQTCLQRIDDSRVGILSLRARVMRHADWLIGGGS